MKILHRYILSQWLRNLTICLIAVTFLFTLIDFFDRIDNIVEEEASWVLTVMYFLYKIPLTVHLMLPVAVLVATMFTIGMLSKNSEITAMRSSGVTLFWLARPLLFVGLILSLTSIVFNETVVPYCSRKSSEIYNLDIKKKNESGSYSKENFWWRDKNTFYSFDMFDSRKNELVNFSRFNIDSGFNIEERTESPKVKWLDQNLGWNMKDVVKYDFADDGAIAEKETYSLPLPIEQTPRYFYDVELKPEVMGFFALKKYMKALKKDGISIEEYKADLRAKFSFPFINFICILIALPFALKGSRSGGMAFSFLTGITIGFGYYFIHSFAIALGRAELLNPMVAAWSANLLLGFVGLVLNWGAEAP